MYQGPRPYSTRTRPTCTGNKTKQDKASTLKPLHPTSHSPISPSPHPHVTSIMQQQKEIQEKRGIVQRTLQLQIPIPNPSRQTPPIPTPLPHRNYLSRPVKLPDAIINQKKKTKGKIFRNVQNQKQNTPSPNNPRKPPRLCRPRPSCVYFEISCTRNDPKKHRCPSPRNLPYSPYRRRPRYLPRQLLCPRGYRVATYRSGTRLFKG